MQRLVRIGLTAPKHLLVEKLGQTRSARDAADNPKEQRRLQKLWDEQFQFIRFISRIQEAPK